jgi:SAM-dependent methyltransferase
MWYLKKTKLTAKELSEKSVLDIGSGDGTSTYNLAPYVKTIYGLEPNKTSLKKARLLNRKFKFKNIRFYEGAIENIPFVRKFDIIRFRNSLQFMNPIYALKKSLELLNINGLIIIRLPLSYPNAIDKRLEKNNTSFDKDLFDKNISINKKYIKTVNKFFKKYNKLYENSNKERYYLIVKIK